MGEKQLIADYQIHANVMYEGKPVYEVQLPCGRVWWHLWACVAAHQKLSNSEPRKMPHLVELAEDENTPRDELEMETAADQQRGAYGVPSAPQITLLQRWGYVCNS